METENKSRKILSDITVYMKYAKFIPELERKESWIELCQRNMDMHIKKFEHLGGFELYIIMKF